MSRKKVLEKQEEHQEQKKENMSANQETQTVQEEKKIEIIENDDPEVKGMLLTFYEYFIGIINTIVPALKWLYFISKVYIIWITIHYISCQLYVHYCVPTGVMGYLISPFLVSSPQCKALRWAFYNGGNIIDNMWNYLGVWASTQLLKIE